MKLKTTIKKCYGFAHVYLRLLNPLLYGAPSYKSGVRKVNSRGAYSVNVGGRSGHTHIAKHWDFVRTDEVVGRDIYIHIDI